MAKWWQHAILYQIYPRSFMDASGDGVGDLPGIIQRLDDLHWLGVDAVWLSPVYPSPMADFGYDISDHTAIDPLFGTLDDMDALIAAAHERGMRVIMDFVPNHTSDQHPWFLESRASRDNLRRDWYYWHDPAPDGGPPNNWLSRFDGKSAWAWDATTGQYYLHSFLTEQPDLNWRNPDVRQAMTDVMRFWLDRGVDGLRVDVPYRVMKAADLRDNPPNPDWREGDDPAHRVLQTYTRNYADSHLFNRWLRRVIDEYDEKLLIGEMNLPVEAAVKHFGTQAAPEFHLPFNATLIFSPWTAANVRETMRRYYAALPDFAWPNWVLSNHDQPRFATRAARFAGAQQARNGLLFLLTAYGTPTLYYADELGLTSQPIPPEAVQDPWEKFNPGLGLGRDPSRTPMPWDNAPNAGFTPEDVTPWLPLGPDYTAQNVASLRQQPDSILNMVKSLIELRRASPVLLDGDLALLEAPEGVVAYTRSLGDSLYMIALNLTAEPVSWAPPFVSLLKTRFTTIMDGASAINGNRIHLRPHEGVVLA